MCIFPSRAGRGRPKINVAGGALVSFNLRSSFLGRPQGRNFFSKIPEPRPGQGLYLNALRPGSGPKAKAKAAGPKAKARARALIKRLKAGTGAEGKSQGQGFKETP